MRRWVALNYNQDIKIINWCDWVTRRLERRPHTCRAGDILGLDTIGVVSFFISFCSASMMMILDDDGWCGRRKLSCNDRLFWRAKMVRSSWFIMNYQTRIPWLSDAKGNRCAERRWRLKNHSSHAICLLRHLASACWVRNVETEGLRLARLGPVGSP